MSAALAAMIRKKKELLYGSPDGSGNLEGQSTAPLTPAEETPKVVKYQPTTVAFSGANKCCICEKTVYKTEEVVAVGRVWHNGCFVCGGAAGDGCGRVLRRDGYSDHNSQPYCTACSSKLFKPKGYGHGTALHLDAAPAHSTESPAKASAPPVDAFKTPEPTPVKEVVSPTPAPATPSVAPTPPKLLAVLKDIKAAAVIKEEIKPVKYTPKVVNMAFNSTPKCTICAKSVYKMEEMVAVGRVWHLNCFTCGGSSAEGCKRVLKRDGYVDHENNPFCIACHSKLYRPKGFGYGNTLNTDYGPAPTVEEITLPHTAVIDANEVTAAMAHLHTTPPPAPPPPAEVKISSPQMNLHHEVHALPPAAAPSSPVWVAKSAPAAAPPPPAPAPPAVPVTATAPAAVEKKVVAAPKPAGRSSFTGETTGSAPVAAGHIAIGASSRSAGAVFKEAAYVGDNDEVDENEWD